MFSAHASAQNSATESSSARAVGVTPAASSNGSGAMPSVRRLARSILRRCPNAAAVTRSSAAFGAGASGAARGTNDTTLDVTFGGGTEAARRSNSAARSGSPQAGRSRGRAGGRRVYPGLASAPGPHMNDLWYKNAILYCLSVGTYMDANGDGIGDFTGLTRRLDYLHGLGVSAIWLMPFQVSPHKDDGYDVSDYYGVDPRYGTLGDFVEFTHAAEQRGIRVLIDLVVNHTSDQHEWFQDARKNPDSRYRNWYIRSDKKPANADEGMVFPGVQKSTWTFDKEARAWYFHRFYDFQPDLNTSNPEVQAELFKIMGFWIQLGVSGFRMDAVPFIISAKGPAVKSSREQYDMLRGFRDFLQWRQADCI